MTELLFRCCPTPHSHNIGCNCETRGNHGGFKIVPDMIYMYIVYLLWENDMLLRILTADAFE